MDEYPYFIKEYVGYIKWKVTISDISRIL